MSLKQISKTVLTFIMVLNTAGAYAMDDSRRVDDLNMRQISDNASGWYIRSVLNENSQAANENAVGLMNSMESLSPKEDAGANAMEKPELKMKRSGERADAPEIQKTANIVIGDNQQEVVQDQDYVKYSTYTTTSAGYRDGELNTVTVRDDMYYFLKTSDTQWQLDGIEKSLKTYDSNGRLIEDVFTLCNLSMSIRVQTSWQYEYYNDSGIIKQSRYTESVPGTSSQESVFVYDEKGERCSGTVYTAYMHNGLLFKTFLYKQAYTKDKTTNRIVINTVLVSNTYTKGVMTNSVTTSNTTNTLRLDPFSYETKQIESRHRYLPRQQEARLGQAPNNGKTRVMEPSAGKTNGGIPNKPKDTRGTPGSSAPESTVNIQDMINGKQSSAKSGTSGDSGEKAPDALDRDLRTANDGIMGLINDSAGGDMDLAVSEIAGKKELGAADRAILEIAADRSSIYQFLDKATIQEFESVILLISTAEKIKDMVNQGSLLFLDNTVVKFTKNMDAVFEKYASRTDGAYSCLANLLGVSALNEELLSEGGFTRMSMVAMKRAKIGAAIEDMKAKDPAAFNGIKDRVSRIEQRVLKHQDVVCGSKVRKAVNGFMAQANTVVSQIGQGGAFEADEEGWSASMTVDNR